MSELDALTESTSKHGYAFEAASSVIHDAFELAGLGEIVGIVDVPNLSSWGFYAECLNIVKVGSAYWWGFLALRLFGSHR